MVELAEEADLPEEIPEEAFTEEAEELPETEEEILPEENTEE